MGVTVSTHGGEALPQDGGPVVALARERDWLVPAAGLTLVTGSVAFGFAPFHAGFLRTAKLLPTWLEGAFMLATFALLIAVLGMMVRGTEQPLAVLAERARRDRSRLLITAAGVVLAGMNMVAFLWLKPVLNVVVDFRTDTALAALDHALFLGHDPWTLLTWLNFEWSNYLYHQTWFAGMIVSLLMTLYAPPSPQRSAVLVSYFLLWSVVGPLVHTLAPAAGPIFFEQLGHGSRFAGLDGGEQNREIAEYLWLLYSSGHFGAGGGISAMPSMHVTSATWMVIAFAALRPRWTLPVAAGAVLIFLLSISLGWHYALDGVVGAACAVATYAACRAWFVRRAAGRELAERVGATP